MPMYKTTKPTPLEWGDYALKVRRACRLTQEAMARRCGVSPRTIQRWESGETVPGETVRRFIERLKRTKIARENLKREASDA